MDLTWCMQTILTSYPEILLFMTIFLFLYITFRVNRKNAPLINWPVFGMLPSILLHLHHFHDYAVQLFSASGMSFMFRGPWFTGMDMLLTCDPDNVNYVFNTQGKLYPKGDDLLEMFAGLGDCMLTNEGEKWKQHRRETHRILFNQKFLEYEFQAINTKLECLIPFLERCAQENKVIDLQDVFLRVIFDMVCVTFIGVDPGCLNYEFPAIPFAKALDTIEEGVIYQHLFPKIIVKLLKKLNVGFMKNISIATQILDQFVAQKIEEKIVLIQQEKKNNERDQNNAPADLLAPSLMEIAELQACFKSNTINLLLAATDTTVASVTWFFWLLTKHPEVEDKIINELKTICTKKENWNSRIWFDIDSLQKLVYLHGAICECLRLYPPAPFQHKTATRTDVLPSGHKVTPGTFLIFHTYSMGRMKSIWGEDCMEFKPERWINQKGEIRHEPAYKFFTFDCGARSCLGKEMAIRKMKMVIGAMLCSFRVEVVQGHVVEPNLGVILNMKHGLMARVIKRETF